MFEDTYTRSRSFVVTPQNVQNTAYFHGVQAVSFLTRTWFGFIAKDDDTTFGISSKPVPCRMGASDSEPA